MCGFACLDETVDVFLALYVKLCCKISKLSLSSLITYIQYIFNTNAQNVLFSKGFEKFSYLQSFPKQACRYLIAMFIYCNSLLASQVYFCRFFAMYMWHTPKEQK